MTRLAIPFASYVAVTIIVPILNGAHLDGSFAEHVALAAGLPLVIAMVLGRLLPRRRGSTRERRTATAKSGDLARSRLV